MLYHLGLIEKQFVAQNMIQNGQKVGQQLKDFVGETLTPVWSVLSLSGDAQQHFTVTMFPLTGVHAATARRVSRNVSKFMARWPNLLKGFF